ncbi:MAG: hypothetical protein ABR529_08235 [Actinomycetota bacterium]
MAYEIRVVFQSADAYESAVERLYHAFGVDLTGAEVESSANGALRRPEDLDPMSGSAFVDARLAEDPADAPEAAPSFVVEDRTAW